MTLGMSDEIRLIGTCQVLICADDNWLVGRTNIIKERKTPSCGINTGIAAENVKDTLISGHKSMVYNLNTRMKGTNKSFEYLAKFTN
jgi:hypothetical protein